MTRTSKIEKKRYPLAIPADLDQLMTRRRLGAILTILFNRDVDETCTHLRSERVLDEEITVLADTRIIQNKRKHELLYRRLVLFRVQHNIYRSDSSIAESEYRMRRATAILFKLEKRWNQSKSTTTGRPCMQMNWKVFRTRAAVVMYIIIIRNLRCSDIGDIIRIILCIRRYRVRRAFFFFFFLIAPDDRNPRYVSIHHIHDVV